MERLEANILRTVIVMIVIAINGIAFGQSSDSSVSKASNYPSIYSSPYSSLLYSPYSSMSSMYPSYSPLSMSSSMMAPSIYSSYPFGSSYGHGSGYLTPGYPTMAASYPHSTYAPLPYMPYSGYSPLSTYYG
jgi:hypothetical protein